MSETFVELSKRLRLTDIQNDIAFEAWNVACDFKNKQIEILNDQLKIEQACVDFYADKKNYQDTHKGAPRFMTLKKEDGEKKNQIDTCFGGKLARETQQKRLLCLK